jgi:hypothetical protein
MSTQITTQPAPVAINGAVLKNEGPGTVYYRAQPPVTTSTNDGSVLSGASTTLGGTQWLYTDTNASVSLIPIAPNVVIGPTRGTRLTTFPDTTWTAGDQGFAAWSFDPALVAGGTVLATGGTVYGARVHCPVPFTATNVCAYTSTIGGTLTSGQCFGALYNSSGVLLGSTADLSTGANSFNTANAFTYALTTPQTGLPAGDYDVCFFFNGTTGPTFARGQTLAAGLGNMNLATTGIRFFSADAGRTTTMPATLGSKTSLAVAWWVGIS